MYDYVKKVVKNSVIIYELRNRFNFSNKNSPLCNQYEHKFNKKFIHRKMICTIVQTFQDLHPMMFLDCN